MEIAKYFATFGIKIENKDVKQVDTQLNNLEKGLKEAATSTKTLEKDVKSEAKTAVAATKEKVKAQKEYNTVLQATAKNQRAWAKEFAYSVKAMTVKPATAKALKEAQSAYNQLFGAVAPIGSARATARNHKAWANRFQSQMQSLVGGVSGISRTARQSQLEAAFGVPVSNNPRLNNILSQRLSYLGSGKSDVLADMAAQYREDERQSNRRIAALLKEEQIEGRIAEAQRRRLLRNQRIQEAAAAKESKRLEAERKKQEAADAKAEARRQRLVEIERRRVSARNGRYLSGGLSVALPMTSGLGAFSGPAMAVAAPVATAYFANSQAIALGNEQATREAQRTQLDIASGFTDRNNRNIANNRFFALSNRLGVEAAPMIDPYSKFMKQMQTQGKSYKDAFSIYENMSVATRGSGLGQVSMERQAYAMQQIFGLGYAQGDELFKQLVDASPAMLGYLEKEYTKRTGKDASTFREAVSNREITSQYIIDAYATAAKDAAVRVDEFASTVQASQARLANTKLQEQMERTLSDEVIPSMRRYVEAQDEMYKAMVPFRDIMYDTAASVLSFNANILKASAPFVNKVGTALEGAPGLRSIATNPALYLPELLPTTAPLRWAYMGFKALQDSDAPTSEQSQSRISLLESYKNAYSKQPVGVLPTQADGFSAAKMAGVGGFSSNQVTIAPGAIVINAPSGDAQVLSDTLMSALERETSRVMSGFIQTAMPVFPNTGN